MQAESDALAHLLGGEEGLEDVLEVVGPDARALVADRGRHFASGGPGAYADASLFAHGLSRIHQYVQEYLLDLGFVGLDHGKIAVVLFDQDVFAEGGLGQQEALVDEAVHVAGLLAERRAGPRAGPRKAAQVLDDVPDADGAVLAVPQGLVDFLQRGPGPGVEGAGIDPSQVFADLEQVGVDESDRVVQFMRDSGHQLPQRRQLFAVDELLLRAVDLADQFLQLSVLLDQFARVLLARDVAGHGPERGA